MAIFYKSIFKKSLLSKVKFTTTKNEFNLIIQIFLRMKNVLKAIVILKSNSEFSSLSVKLFRRYSCL